MPKIKEVTTTVEDEVTFMVDPKVEFVSLVKYGANRAPFKIIKSDKTKEDDNMNKVVQSVLVRNDLSDENITKALEGIDRRDKKEFTTFTAYPQVPLAKVNEDSLYVQKHEEVDGIFFVLGDLAEGVGDSGTLQVEVTEKEAVDYATMDNLYSELYAMADVVGGAMRQENADADFRKNTILTTIDNFRAFAEVVLENLSEKAIEKGVKAEDHPDLVVDILHAIQTAEVVDTTEDEDEESKKKEGEETPTDEKTEEEEEEQTAPDFNAVVASFNESLNTFGEKLIESITASTKEVTETSKKTTEAMEKVSEQLEDMRNTTVNSKAEKEEDTDPIDTGRPSQSDRLFKGTFFKGFSDFR
jgi:hypothetical protein